MTSLKDLRFLMLASVMLCSSAIAQTRFCIGGDLDHLTKAEKAACNAKLQAVREVASALRAPEDWHVVLVCGQQGWQDYLAYAAAAGTALQGADISTDLEQHETFLNEQHVNLNDMGALRQLVAGEIENISRAHEQLAADSHSFRLAQKPAHSAGI